MGYILNFMKNLIILFIFSANSFSAVLFRNETAFEQHFTAGGFQKISSFQTNLRPWDTPEFSEHSLWAPSVVVDLYLLLHREAMGTSRWEINNTLLNWAVSVRDWNQEIKKLEAQIMSLHGEIYEPLKFGIQRGVFQRVLQIELEAEKHKKVPVWRMGISFDAQSKLIQLEKDAGLIKGPATISFGQTFLGGWVLDGCYYANPDYGFTRLGACVYQYWHNWHKTDGESRKFKELESKNYSFQVVLLDGKLDGNDLKMGNMPEIMQVLHGRGEEFHPKLPIDEISKLTRLDGDDWYNDEEVRRALQNRVQEENLISTVSVLAPIGGTLQGQQLRSLVEGYLRETGGELSVGQSLVISYNLGFSHWVGILIHRTDTGLIAEMIDSLGVGRISEELRNALSQELSAALGESIRLTDRQATLIQRDGISCGPMMVENLLHRVSELRQQPLVFQEMDPREIRRHHVGVTRTPSRSSGAEATARSSH